MNIKINNRDDWSQKILETEKLFIKAGKKDTENGNTFSLDQVMEEVSKSYSL